MLLPIRDSNTNTDEPQLLALGLTIISVVETTFLALHKEG